MSFQQAPRAGYRFGDPRPSNEEEPVHVPASRQAGMPNWLYVLVVAALGIYFVIGGIAWVVFAYQGRNFPESLATMLATIAGGLVGILAPSGTQGTAATTNPER